MYTGKKFRINALGASYVLAEGVISEHLKTEARYDWYRATVTIMFNPNNIHDVGAVVALRNDEFHMRTDNSEVFGDYSRQFEWID